MNEETPTKPKKISLRAIGTNIIFERIDLTPTGEANIGGIIVPDFAKRDQEMTWYGKVLNVGNMVAEISQGDLILVIAYKATIFKLPSGKVLYVVDQDGVTAVVKEEQS